MRVRVLAPLAVAVAALPSVAFAGAGTSPVTFGVGLGITQSKAEAGQDPNDSLGLWARLALSPRLSVQLELAKSDTATSGDKVTSVDGLVIIDLAAGAPGAPRTSRFVPYLLAGAGLDDASFSGGETDQTAKHVEAGLGLEYRAASGLVIGADVRIGDRSTDSSPVYNAYPTTIAFSLPAGLYDGEYRSARLTAGIHF